MRDEDGIYTAPGTDRKINPDIPDLPECRLWPSTGLSCMHKQAPLWARPTAFPGVCIGDGRLAAGNVKHAVLVRESSMSTIGSRAV